jgi:hypothetical protein
MRRRQGGQGGPPLVHPIHAHRRISYTNLYTEYTVQHRAYAAHSSQLTAHSSQLIQLMQINDFRIQICIQNTLYAIQLMQLTHGGWPSTDTLHPPSASVYKPTDFYREPLQARETWVRVFDSRLESSFFFAFLWYFLIEFLVECLFGILGGV